MQLFNYLKRNIKSNLLFCFRVVSGVFEGVATFGGPFLGGFERRVKMYYL